MIAFIIWAGLGLNGIKPKALLGPNIRGRVRRRLARVASCSLNFHLFPILGTQP